MVKICKRCGREYSGHGNSAYCCKECARLANLESAKRRKERLKNDKKSA